MMSCNVFFYCVDAWSIRRAERFITLHADHGVAINIVKQVLVFVFMHPGTALVVPAKKMTHTCIIGNLIQFNNLQTISCAILVQC